MVAIFHIVLMAEGLMMARCAQATLACLQLLSLQLECTTCRCADIQTQRKLVHVCEAHKL